MVGKLMKHELRAIFRVLMWFMIAVALLSVLMRVTLELVHPFSGPVVVGSSAIGLTLMRFSITSFWYLSVAALSCAGSVMCLVRFFKSLFTGEGYMTFSLPVTPTQLLVSKFLSAFIVTISCLVEIALSVLIAVPFEEFSILWNDISFVLPEISAFLSAEPLFTTELVLLLVVMIPMGLVYLFLIASIGQLFTKGRVIITIALYYGASFLIGIVLSVLLIPLLQLGYTLSMHIVMWAFIALIAAFDVGGFFIIRYILSHKVNLVV